MELTHYISGALELPHLCASSETVDMLEQTTQLHVTLSLLTTSCIRDNVAPHFGGSTQPFRAFSSFA